MVDRKTGSPQTIVAPQAYVSVIGGIQPGVFRRAFGKEHRESGLAARLLVTHPPRIAKTWTEADIGPEVEAELEANVNRLYDLRPTSDTAGEAQPISVALSPEAKIAFIEYFNGHNLQQVEMAGDLAAAWSKLEEYAARLALVIQLARWAAEDPTLACAETVDIVGMRAGYYSSGVVQTRGQTRLLHARRERGGCRAGQAARMDPAEGGLDDGPRSPTRLPMAERVGHGGSGIKRISEDRAGKVARHPDDPGRRPSVAGVQVVSVNRVYGTSVSKLEIEVP